MRASVVLATGQGRASLGPQLNSTLDAWDELRRVFRLLSKLISRIRSGPATCGWKSIPFLMRVGTVGSAFWGVFIVAMGLLALLGVQPITDSEGRPLDLVGNLALSLSVLPVGTMLLVVAYAFWTERLWSRHIATAFWLVMGGMSLLTTFLGGNNEIARVPYILWSLGSTIGAAWYFYMKGNVDQYFVELKARRPSV